jgi:hypothetical protein
MPAKKPPASKPKNYARLSQKQKFIAAAKAAEADESGEIFDQAVRKVIKRPLVRTGSRIK